MHIYVHIPRKKWLKRGCHKTTLFRGFPGQGAAAAVHTAKCLGTAMAQDALKSKETTLIVAWIGLQRGCFHSD